MERSTLKLTLLLVCTALANASFAIRYHVNTAASGTGTGLSWANAFTDIQTALSLVVPSDEIWVAAGQYKPTATATRTISFVLRNGVNMYGGFAGTETELTQRDIASNPTVLNGDIGEVGDNSDNSHNIVTANNITTTITLDGFRIMNGQSGSSYNGGGLKYTNGQNGQLVLKNCSFLSNFAANSGGAIYMASAILRIEDCEFNNNQSTSGDGAAIYVGNNNGDPSTLHIHTSTFKNNVSRRGACLYNSVSYEDLIIDRCVFTNNTSEFSILNIDDFSTSRISNSYIIGNTVNGSSSNVLYVNSTNDTEVFTMSNCTFANNYNLYTNTLQEEILFFQDSWHRIENSILYGNTAYSGRQLNTSAIVSHSDVQGGHASGTSIVTEDPQFLDPYIGVPSIFDATAYDYRLGSSSPAVNVGNNTFVIPEYELDLDGFARIQGGVVDLGCYESDLNVSVGEAIHTKSTLRFDAERSEICIQDPKQNELVVIHGIGGKLIARVAIKNSRMRIDLPTGIYLATCPGRLALKFVIP